ncbi:MAG: MBL fold metallo-hydrolase [Betaproteobacteria bacterium]|nr:MBL fold metallo-hydrolase [Betaproteobacteria bacterium]MSQ89204.1 MBL fold metallo-hydrolase [Betaproteobacteria bacterium]
MLKDGLPKAKTEPRPAATLLLLRDAPGAGSGERPAASGTPEVFMLQRTSKAAFLPGAFVFPGGALDADDASARAAQRVRGLDDAQASARLGLATGGLAYWVAAARECFEESGILLAWDEKERPLAPQRAAALEHLRQPLNAGTLLFSEILEREQLFVPAHEIAYYSHWITAPGRARRFSTRFFVACAPVGQHGAHDQSETVHSVWISPREAVERGKRGEIELIFPTRSTLADLSSLATPQAVLEHAKGLGDIEVNAACWALDHEGSQRLFRRTDPPYSEIHWSDPEEQGNTCFVIQPGIAKRLDQYVTRLTAPNPGVMTGPGTNTYLVGQIDNGGDLAVIDPGPALESHLAKILEIGGGRIRWILTTHTHLDHSPAAAALKAATGAQLLGRPAPAGANQDQGYRADRIVSDGERLSLGTLHLRALHTPGHASNHLCYLLEDSRMLFTGDHVMQGSTVVINPPDGDMRAYLASLDKLLAEDLAIIAPGHGYLIGAPHKEVKRLVAHRLAREAKVAAALKRHGAATLDELVPQVYDDVSPKLHPVATRSLSAHLDKLVAEGRVRQASGRYILSAE